jgi:hypothetical protein
LASLIDPEDGYPHILRLLLCADNPHPLIRIVPYLTIDTIGNLLRRGDVALSASFMSEAATLRIPR